MSELEMLQAIETVLYKLLQAGVVTGIVLACILLRIAYLLDSLRGKRPIKTTDRPPE